MKINKLQEAFLSQYFCIEAIVKPLGCDLKAVFDSLLKVFCLESSTVQDNLFLETQHHDIASVETVEDYEQVMRVIGYTRLMGHKLPVSEQRLMVLECKGAAYEKIKALRQSIGNGYSSERVICETLSETISSQSICIMGMTGFMLCEGLVVPKDVRKGLDLALKCARWNSVFGCLLLLRYSDKHCEKNLTMLRTIIAESMLKDTYDEAFKVYGGDAETLSTEVTLMARYLRRNPSAREKYNPQVARIAYSSLLSSEDKNRIMLSGSDEEIAIVNELPLGTGNSECPIPSCSISTHTILQRDNEVKKLDICLQEQKRGVRAKSPLLICSDSFAKEDYIQAIKKVYSKSHIGVVNAALLQPADLSPSRYHFVIANLINAKASEGVFIIDNVEELDDALHDEFTKLLQSETKKVFKLQEPRLSLNLQKCVFILFAKSEAHIQGLTGLCRVVRVDKLNEEERALMVRNHIRIAKEAYDCDRLSFNEEAVEVLCSLETDECKDAIEKVCCDALYSERTDGIISASDIENNLERASHGLGFVIKGGRK